MLALGDAGDELGAGEGGGDEEDDAHGEGDGHRGIAQEQQALGHLHLFAAVGLVAELGADPAGQHVGAGGEVAERHVIGAGDLLHVGVGEGRNSTMVTPTTRLPTAMSGMPLMPPAERMAATIMDMKRVW